MSRIEVLPGPERRRRWSAEQKRSIVAEAFAPGASETIKDVLGHLNTKFFNITNSYYDIEMRLPVF
jgi:hypothetical protein